MSIAKKPHWLRKKANPHDQILMRNLLGELRLNTVCQQALCPNISECFSSGQATFMILGSNCTRLCSFCNLEKKEPFPVDYDEPERIAEAVVSLDLKHVVVTSPTRDDLSDGGAGIYASVVAAVRSASPHTRIELLIPDMQGSVASLEKVTSSMPQIIGHNLETVPRLYHIRSGANYKRSLTVLKMCRELAPEILTKSGIMLGMGELEDELLQAFADLREVGCDYLSLGQYLAPSQEHYPVQQYIEPERFEVLKTSALRLGFRHVESAPYVRSSYNAGFYA